MIRKIIGWLLILAGSIFWLILLLTVYFAYKAMVPVKDAESLGINVGRMLVAAIPAGLSTLSFWGSYRLLRR